MALDRQVRMLLKSSAEKIRLYGVGVVTQGTKDLKEAYQLVERTLRSKGSFEYHKSEVLTPEAFLLCAVAAGALFDQKTLFAVCGCRGRLLFCQKNCTRPGLATQSEACLHRQ